MTCVASIRKWCFFFLFYRKDILLSRTFSHLNLAERTPIQVSRRFARCVWIEIHTLVLFTMTIIPLLFTSAFRLEAYETSQNLCTRLYYVNYFLYCTRYKGVLMYRYYIRLVHRSRPTFPVIFSSICYLISILRQRVSHYSVDVYNLLYNMHRLVSKTSSFVMRYRIT